MKKHFSKKIPSKLFGLGVGPAFIGGAGFSFGAGLVSLFADLLEEVWGFKVKIFLDCVIWTPTYSGV